MGVSRGQGIRDRITKGFSLGTGAVMFNLKRPFLLLF